MSNVPEHPEYRDLMPVTDTATECKRLCHDVRPPSVANWTCNAWVWRKKDIWWIPGGGRCFLIGKNHPDCEPNPRT
eukprot:UN08798